jgi:hypothetical protein
LGVSHVGRKIIFVLLMVLLHFTSAASTESTCPWIATYERPVGEVIKMIEDKTGKTPKVSCGAGKDYKVCHSCVDRLSDQQWDRIRNMMAEPSFREWHTGWHSAEGQQRAPRGISDEVFAGENFLYFHRELIRSVLANLAAQGLPCLRIPTELPDKASDPVWPNRSYLTALRNKKVCESQPQTQIQKVRSFQEKLDKESEQAHKMLRAERRKIDDDVNLTTEERFNAEQELWNKIDKDREERRARLRAEFGLTEELIESLSSCPDAQEFASYELQQRSLKSEISETSSANELKNSLGQIGANINYGWHGSLHSLYGTVPPRRSNEDCSRGEEHPLCEHLGGLSTTIVNQHFYLIHGTVDSVIDKWLSAHNYETASLDCKGKSNCYQWKGNYAATPPDFLTGKSCQLKHESGTASSENSNQNNRNVQ